MTWRTTHGECRTKVPWGQCKQRIENVSFGKAQGMTLRTTPREHRTKSLDDNVSKELKMVFCAWWSNLLAKNNGGPKVGCVQCGPKLQDWYEIRVTTSH